MRSDRGRSERHPCIVSPIGLINNTRFSSLISMKRYFYFGERRCNDGTFISRKTDFDVFSSFFSPHRLHQILEIYRVVRSNGLSNNVTATYFCRRINSSTCHPFSKWTCRKFDKTSRVVVK